MNYEVSKEIVSHAESFWDDEGLPFLRAAAQGEHVLILGWSAGQELPCLLIEEADGDDYGESAREADILFPNNLPSEFTCEGKIVASLSREFYDGNCERLAEVTFLNAWHATLLQCWLDKEGVPICIRPSSSMQDEKVISDHTAHASHSFDRTIRHAAFKNMSIRHEIRAHVGACWSTNRALPTGTHTLPSGTAVTFASGSI